MISREERHRLRRAASVGASLLVLLAAASPLPCAAQKIYKNVAPDGTVSYTDTPQQNGTSETVTTIAPPPSEGEHEPLKAAITVYEWEILVDAVSRFCQTQVPSTATTVLAAKSEWMERNADLRARKITVLHQLLTNEQLVGLATQATQTNVSILRRIEAAPLAEKTKWCQSAPRQFAAYGLDPMSHPVLVATLQNFKAPR
jgi:hypothetical protein